MEKRSKTVDRTNGTIYNLELLVSVVKDGETGIRGFALTHDSTFLLHHDTFKARIDSIYNIIEGSISFDSVQQVRMELLRSQLNSKMLILKNAEQQLFASGSLNPDFVGKEFPDTKWMSGIRKTVKIMQDHEHYKLQERVDKYNETYASLKITNLISLIFAIILAIGALVTFEKENKAKKIYRTELEAGIEKLKTANKELVELKSIEKFAISGRISRTLAHEIRNPLTSIALATDQLKESLADNEDNAFLLDIIKRNSDRINALISKLLNSTKFSELQLSLVSPGAILDEALDLAADRINLQGIKIVKNYSSQMGKIEIDAEKMKLAFLNIIVNAIEAMEPGKGVLEIKTETRDNKCLITIKDNGFGMDKESVSKIFEPYFTTKEAGNGLGLTNTQNIILNHNGNITLESIPSKGTTFYIMLNFKLSSTPIEKATQYS
ncbi:MAG TPA: ATP-binding protein [Bacteroidales bacterium]|nr:ATP-binding protein [Bacteroidales bacterium]